MKLLVKRIRIGLFVILATMLLFSCDLLNSLTGGDDKQEPQNTEQTDNTGSEEEKPEGQNTEGQKPTAPLDPEGNPLPVIYEVSPATTTELIAGSIYTFTFKCDELDVVRVSYQNEKEELEYDYIYKENGSFSKRLAIPKKATEVQLYVPNAKGKNFVSQKYKVKDTVTFGDYTTPDSYDKAKTYRTNEPYQFIVDLLKDETLEATRAADPLKYIEDVSAKIKTEAGTDQFKQVKMIHDLLTLLIPYDVAGNRQSPRPPQDYWTVLQKKIGVCQGYAWTFNKFCEIMGIDCDYVYGWAHGSNGKKGETHAWDIVRIEGKCYLVDCTWDAGYVDDDFKANYSTGYLFLNPSIFIYSHYPENPDHQLLENPVKENVFVTYPEIKPEFFDSIENPENNPLLKLAGPAVAAEGTYSFSYKMNKTNQVFYASVYKDGETESINNAHIFEYGENETTLKFSFPEAGEYEVYIMLFTDGATRGPICATFKVNAEKASDIKYVQIYQPLSAATPVDMTLERGKTYTFNAQLAKEVDKVFIRYFYKNADDGKYYYLSKYDQLLEANGDKVFTGEVTVLEKLGTRDAARIYIYYIPQGGTDDDRKAVAIYDLTAPTSGDTE